MARPKQRNTARRQARSNWIARLSALGQTLPLKLGAGLAILVTVVIGWVAHRDSQQAVRIEVHRLLEEVSSKMPGADEPIAASAEFKDRLRQLLPKLDEALRLDPKSSWAYDLLGIYHMHIGAVGVAANDFKTSMRLDPTVPEPHLNYAVLLEREARAAMQGGHYAHGNATYAAAISEYDRAIEIYSACVPAYVGKAAAILSRYEDTPVVARAIGDAAQLWEKIGLPSSAEQLASAAQLLERAITLDPTNDVAYSSLGVIYELQGRAAEGLSMHRRALEIKPNSAHAEYNLGYAFMMLGQLDDAEAALKRSLALVPTYARAFALLGHVQIQHGNHGQGLAALVEAQRLGLNDPALGSNIEWAKGNWPTEYAQAVAEKLRVGTARAIALK